MTTMAKKKKSREQYQPKMLIDSAHKLTLGAGIVLPKLTM
jgi:hypothetical protein